jgi:hypothetical protein
MLVLASALYEEEDTCMSYEEEDMPCWCWQVAFPEREQRSGAREREELKKLRQEFFFRSYRFLREDFVFLAPWVSGGGGEREGGVIAGF